MLGRDFSANDVSDGNGVAIVSEAMARKFWPGQNPIGRRVKDIGPGSQGAEVIGVARDIRMRSLRDAARPLLYVPMSQFYMPRMTILVRAAGDAASLARPVADAHVGLP